MPTMDRPRITKQRARSADDKEVRRAQLLDAAGSMLASRSYEALTLAAVAEAAGLSKASAYTYFPTKEALFLALLARDLVAWLAALRQRLGRRPRTPRSLARAIAESLVPHERLRGLLGRLHSALESNVPEADILAFKRFLAGVVAEGGALVEAALPALPPGQGAHALLVLHALVIGLSGMAQHTPVVERALAADPVLARRFELDFATELAGLLEVILTGWCTR